VPFRDRTDAGRRLARALSGYKNRQPVILALPRGGLPVAAEVARALDAPLDLLIVRKIGVPFQPELAMGAVVDGLNPLVVRNEDIIRLVGISASEFAAVCEVELAEIRRRRQRYLAGRPHPVLEGRSVIVVDDGIATGATMRAALRAVRQQRPDRLVLAIPVASVETLQDFRGEADEIICLEEHDPFGSIGAYYADFKQLSDEEVVEILAGFPLAAPTTQCGS
jgi:predicted phosphoribosyltransferase